VEIWETSYVRHAESAAALIDAMRTASLAPYLEPLDDQMRRRFLDRYSRELERAYPRQPDGSFIVRFPRVFVIARL